VRAARTLLSAALILVARASATQDLYDPGSLELRAGYLVSVALPFFRSGLFPERGTSNLNLELVLPKIWRASGRLDALLPRLHLGGTVNVDGRTSYAYAGALWTFNYARRGFAELSFGGLLHDGQLTGTDQRLARLGCRWLYEVGANLGYRLNDRTSLLLSFDHGSNGKDYLSHCALNEGLDLLGLRLGYRF
jgi:lipid A 3-O-deacylase